MSTRVPPFCDVSDDSIVACALPRPRASRALADSFARRDASSASSRFTSAANVSEIGPSFTLTVAFQLASSIVSSSFAPGMHGMMRGTSIRSAHAASGAAGTSNVFSSRIRRAPLRTASGSAGRRSST